MRPATSPRTLSLDLRDLPPGVPVAKVAVAMARLHPGEHVEVLATGHSAVRDFAVWCLATGSQLLEVGQEAGVLRFVIQKR